MRPAIRYFAIFFTIALPFVTARAQQAPGSAWIRQAPPCILRPAYIAPPGTCPKIAAPLQLMTVYSHGDPSDTEQYMLELINCARMQPDSEGIRLYNSATTDQYLSQEYDAYQQFGGPTKDQVLADFHSYSPKPPLAFNKFLIQAARGHSNKMIQVDSQYHEGPDGTPSSRMSAAGYDVSHGYSGENIFAFGNDDIWYDHAVFQYDFGNPGLGHRLNIMNFDPSGPQYTEIGLGMIHGGAGTYPHVGPLVTTEDFAQGSTNFILGVVYNDKNHNNFYDIGEGISGVTISASGGSFTAVTSTSGGYAIPYSGSGNVTVTASGGPLPSQVQKSVQFNGENVKVDFTTSASLQVTTNFPPNDTLLNVSGTTFTWSAITSATKYRIQIDTMMSFSSPKKIVNDSSLTTTSKTVTGLMEGVYYWRVQAKINNAWASYSDVQTLTIALPPAAVTLIAPTEGARVGDSAIAFLWHAPLQEVSYMFIIASDKALVNAVIKDSNLQVSDDTSYTVFGNQLNANTTYYWTVLAKNDNGWSAPASPRSFVTSPAAGVEENAYGFDVSVSPNPTSSVARLSFTLAHESQVAIHIFNALGQDVRTENLGRLGTGAHEWKWNASQLPAGSYYYELRAGDRLEAGRIQVVR